MLRSLKHVVLEIVLLFCIFQGSNAQQINYFSDVFYGGVTGGGYNPGFSYTTGTINLHIPLTSTIRKALLICSNTKNVNQTSFDVPQNIMINGEAVSIDTSYSPQNNYIVNIPANPAPFEYATLIKDITNLSSIQATSIINITPPAFSGIYLPIYWEFYVLILYEDNSMTKVAVDLFVNTQNADPIENYALTPSNQVDFSNNIGLALNTASLCDTTQDGSYVYINSNPIGLIGGTDFNNHNINCSSISTNFYYENNTLYGLTDDISDPIMQGTDALANIQSYGTSTPINVDFIYQSPNWAEGTTTNIINQLFLTYTTPCDTFSVKLLTEDTTVCRGQTVQLGASGGNTALSKPAYEWLPQKDLSCYNCPNPVFSGDSSQVYTVRIWNTDSCSKVLPVRVKVLPPPVFGQITTQATVCGSSTGSLTANDSMAGADSLFFNGSFAGLTPLTISNLGAGTDTLYLKDSMGCVSQDTLVTINSTNNTEALFSVNPQTGAAPLSVSTNNQSTNATVYLWYFLNDSTTAFAPNMTFDTSGTYNIVLLAYQNNIACADTFSLSVTVYDSLQIVVPNVITANGDGINDVFSIQVNAPCKGSVTIVNRWGNVVFTKDFEVGGSTTLSLPSSYKLSLWDGSTTLTTPTGSPPTKVDDGVYFYVFHITDNKGASHKLQGFVSVVR